MRLLKSSSCFLHVVSGGSLLPTLYDVVGDNMIVLVVIIQDSVRFSFMEPQNQGYNFYF